MASSKVREKVPVAGAQRWDWSEREAGSSRVGQDEEGKFLF